MTSARCSNPYLATVKPLLGIVIAVALAASACANGTVETPPGNTPIEEEDPTEEENPTEDAACDGTPSGGSETRTRYAEASVAYDASCTSEEQTRTCTNGVWSAWSGTYQAEACAPIDPAPCGDAPHDTVETRTRYAEASVAYDASCTSEEQTRTCTNGVWSAWSGTYENEACAPLDPLACDDVPHGGTATRVRYATAWVDYGESCASEEQTGTCVNGTVVDWTGTYATPDCWPLPGDPCGDVSHGATSTIWRYPTATVPFGHTCAAEPYSFVCEDGTLIPLDGEPASEHETCVAEDPPPCTSDPFTYLSATFDAQELGPVEFLGPTEGLPTWGNSGASYDIVSDGGDGQSLRVTTTTTSSTQSLRFDLLGGRELREGSSLEISVDLRPEANGGEIWVRLREADGAAQNFSELFFTPGGWVHRYDQAGFAMFAAPYSLGSTVRLRWVFAIDAGTYDLFVNDTQIVTARSHGIPSGPTGHGIGGVLFAAKGGADAPTQFLVDDLSVVYTCVAPSDPGGCVDLDQDGYGESCDAGADCDDADWRVNPGRRELPDDGRDNDCDAGDLQAGTATGVFVNDAGTAGCQDASRGTRSSPNCTLAAAIGFASAGEHVFIAAGRYEGADALQLDKGLHLHGGYDGGTWTRASSDPTATTIASTGASANYVMFVGSTDGDLVTLSHLTLEASQTPLSAGGAALRVTDPPNNDPVVWLERVKIVAGKRYDSTSNVDLHAISLAAAGISLWVLDSELVMGENGDEGGKCSAIGGGTGAVSAHVHHSQIVALPACANVNPIDLSVTGSTLTMTNSVIYAPFQGFASATNVPGKIRMIHAASGVRVAHSVLYSGGALGDASTIGHFEGPSVELANNIIVQDESQAASSSVFLAPAASMSPLVDLYGNMFVHRGPFIREGATTISDFAGRAAWTYLGDDAMNQSLAWASFNPWAYLHASFDWLEYTEGGRVDVAQPGTSSLLDTGAPTGCADLFTEPFERGLCTRDPDGAVRDATPNIGRYETP